MSGEKVFGMFGSMQTEHCRQNGVIPRRWWNILVVVLAAVVLGTSWALVANVTWISLDSVGI